MRGLRGDLPDKGAVACAPGKIILLGEHAVVYDRPGIATAVSVLSRVSVEPSDEFVLVNYGKALRISLDDIEEMGREIDEVVARRDFETLRIIARDRNVAPLYVVYVVSRSSRLLPAKIVIETEVRKGMGSSASVFSALALAYARYAGAEVSGEEVSAAAYAGDVVAHGGTPSGIDNTVVTQGGYIRFRRSEGFRRISAPPLPLVVVDSGEEASTAEMVALVRAERGRDPEGFEERMNRLASVVEAAERSLVSGNLSDLGRLMLEYYEILSTFGISTEALDEIVKTALSLGALGAKPTGAWGGGVCVVLPRDAEDGRRLAEEMREMGFDAFSVTAGVEGVRLCSG